MASIMSLCSIGKLGTGFCEDAGAALASNGVCIWVFSALLNLMPPWCWEIRMRAGEMVH